MAMATRLRVKKATEVRVGTKSRIHQHKQSLLTVFSCHKIGILIAYCGNLDENWMKTHNSWSCRQFPWNTGFSSLHFPRKLPKTVFGIKLEGLATNNDKRFQFILLSFVSRMQSRWSSWMERFKRPRPLSTPKRREERLETSTADSRKFLAPRLIPSEAYLFFHTEQLARAMKEKTNNLRLPAFTKMSSLVSTRDGRRRKLCSDRSSQQQIQCRSQCSPNLCQFYHSWVSYF